MVIKKIIKDKWISWEEKLFQSVLGYKVVMWQMSRTKLVKYLSNNKLEMKTKYLMARATKSAHMTQMQLIFWFLFANEKELTFWTVSCNNNLILQLFLISLKLFNVLINHLKINFWMAMMKIYKAKIKFHCWEWLKITRNPID